MKNPLLLKINEFDSVRVNSALEELCSLSLTDAYIFRKYIYSCPERFFSKSAFRCLFNSLQEIDETHSGELSDYLKQNSLALNNAYRHAQEINAFEWHDQEIKGANDYQTLELVDRQLHPAYLRLVEGVFQPLLRIVAHFSRLAEEKGTQGLNLFSIVQELPDDRFSDVKASYVHLMRNGIAHGGVRYFANEIIYRDGKGNEVSLNPRVVVRKFDDFLDVCNGLMFAYSVFSKVRKNSDISIAEIFFVEDLRAETGTPYWDVTGMLPSKIFENKDQLIIYCRVKTLDWSKILFSALQTAIQAERLSPKYDRYFISMKSENGLPGWVTFDGSKLRASRLNDGQPEEYGELVDEFVPLFLGGIRRARILNKFETLKYAIQIGRPLRLAEYRARIQKPNILVRSSTIHRSSWAAILNADVFIDGEGNAINQDMIRFNASAAMRLAAKQARRKLSRLDIARYLPLGFAQIDVFCTDYRTRRLSGFGLGKDLVGTIRLCRLRRVRAPDISGATVEIWRGYRFAWNRSWMGANSTPE
jgi:hypothetical protein